ncbi:hypothetical protein [Actinomadura chokoriensis]|uniref:hypothetical protein n=1 Tax=Actinomadura chokoriensis TaxID=454156 RepID=UPI0031F99B19
MSYVLVISTDSRAMNSSQFTKIVPRSVDPRSDSGKVCWIFAAEGNRPPRLARVGIVAKPYGEVVATDERRIRVEHVRVLRDPLSLTELSGAMETLHFNRLQRAIEDGEQTLTPTAARDVRRALVTLRPQLRQLIEWLEQIGAPDRTITGQAGIHWAQERDAISLALRLGGFPTTPLQQWLPPADLNDPFISGLVLDNEAYHESKPEALGQQGQLREVAAQEREGEESEADHEDSLADMLDQEIEPNLIDADARIFPGWRSVSRTDRRADVQEFTDDQGRMIEIANVNAGPVETRAGVDLLYFHKSTKSLVGVQYKRLTEKQVWVDDRLLSQITKMKAVSQALKAVPTTPGHWRIGQDWMYLKLAQTRSLNPDSAELIKGLYLPISYLELLLGDQGIRGPKNGRSLGYKNVDRYLSNTLFIDLMKEGWIGSPPTSPRNFMALAEEAVSSGRSAVLAVDHSQETPRERQSRSRGRGAGTS